jgi:hypothetical protein
MYHSAWGLAMLATLLMICDRLGVNSKPQH